MVFGFIKKERRVPDLSRYDYYYLQQQNNADYNKSHRLSTAAASAAAAITSNYNNNNNSPRINRYNVNSRRSQSMIYNSNPYTHSTHNTTTTTNDDHSRRRKNLINESNNNNNNIQSGKNLGDQSNRYSNINYKKTYSLRSQSSFDRNVDFLSFKQRNINNNGTVRSKSSSIPTTTTTTTTTKQRRLNSLSSNNGRTSRLNSLTSNGQARRLNSLSSNNGRTSRLNSLTSNGQARRLNRQQQQQQQQQQHNINDSNVPLGQSSRTNSITTTVTRVTDPLGRTTSITKKTIKRIDGYEYVETTTTTTNLVPLDEVEDDEKLLNPSIQKHFDEFSDNFNITEDEDHDSVLFNDTRNGNNANNCRLALTNGPDPPYHHHDELLQDGPNYSNIDTTLDNGTLQELDDNLSEPKEIIEETDFDISMDNNNRDVNNNSNSNNNNNNNNNGMRENDINGKPEYDEYNNLLLDDIVEEDEKNLQDDEVEELERELDKGFNNESGSHSNGYQSEDEGNGIDETVLNKFDRVQIQNKHFVHPYSSSLIPLDETSSLSKFSDAVESVPSSKENLVPNKSNVSKRSSITANNFKNKINRNPTVNKMPIKKKVVVNRQPSRKNEPSLNVRTTVKKNTKPMPSQQQQQQQPKKHLTEQEMYLKALEVAKKKVYKNAYDTGASTHINMVHSDTRSTMGSRMTLRDQSIPKESIISYHGNSHSTNNKHSSKLFGSSLFSKNKHTQNKPTGISYSSPSIPMTKKFNDNSSGQASIDSLLHSQSRVHSVSNNPSTQNNSRNVQEQALSDEDMYAKALEIAQKRFNDAQKKMIQRQRQEQMNIVKEPEKLVKSDLVESINQDNTTSSVSLDKIERQEGNGINNEKDIQGAGSLGFTSTVVSDQPTDNELKVEQLPSIQESTENLDANGQPNPEGKSNNDGFQQKLGNNSQDGLLLIAHPEEPFDSNNVIPMPKLEPALSNSKHKHLFPHRPKIDVEKNKSKIRNMFDKVVQFSNENSGYQPPKKEKLKMEEQRRLVEQIELAKAENIHEQQLHPPPLKVEPYVSHGAATTLPVQQSLNHFPNGIVPTTSSVLFRKQSNGTNQGTSNDNVTNSSSVFSTSRGQLVDSTTPVEEVLPQQEQFTKGNTNVPRISANTTNISTNSKPTIEKVSSRSSSKKSKSNFFSRLFKRSK